MFSPQIKLFPKLILPWSPKLSDWPPLCDEAPVDGMGAEAS